jgi:1-acyl-sn-glycerol-3-phosphate acyltransferase
MINFYNYLNYLLIPILLPIRIITFIGVNALFLCIPKIFINKNFKNFNFMILLTLGLYPNKIIDTRNNKIDTKIVVFTHRTYADAYIINYICGPISYVFRERLLGNPIVKCYMEKYGGVSVSSDSKTGKTKEILDFLDKNTNYKLAIAPEDITNIKTRVLKNNDLGIFRTGAFAPLLPIQPIAINFHDKSAIWRNYENKLQLAESESMHYWLLRRFLSPVSYFDVYLLEECITSSDAIIYKETVRNQMLEVVKHF